MYFLYQTNKNLRKNIKNSISMYWNILPIWICSVLYYFKWKLIKIQLLYVHASTYLLYTIYIKLIGYVIWIFVSNYEGYIIWKKLLVYPILEKKKIDILIYIFVLYINILGNWVHIALPLLFTLQRPNNIKAENSTKCFSFLKIK